MGVTRRTLDLAAQAEAHTTATVDAYTYSLIDHHQGRCSALPVTKSAKELGLAGGDVPGLRPTQVDAKEKFEALPEHVQREILGKERFEAWKAGRYPMSTWPQRVQHYETVNG